MATKKAAHWASTQTPHSLPNPVRQSALRSFYNWVGCAIGGSTHPATTIAHKSLSRFFGAPTSALLGTRGNKVDAQHAALLNGIASHVHDYDDTHLDTIIHPTGPVAAALLAIAEGMDRPVSGEEFLTALAVGIEVECKIGLAVWPSHYDVGWHITSTTGSIGAAVAVSHLLHLDETKTAHAIGLAATQVTGLREMFGSHTKSFHPGRAAQNGLIAALLAEQGYTSSEQALEAPRGWAKVVGRGEDTLTKQVDSLFESGRVWELQKNAFKPFPCGIVIHPVIDGCVWVHGELKRRGLSSDDVQGIHALVHPLVLELTGKTSPKDGLEAKFSVYHGGAVAVLYGKATPAQYEDAVVTDPRTVTLREKITATASGHVRPDECRLTVQLAGGTTTIEWHVDHAVGSVYAPMSDAQLTAKFIDQCGDVVGVEQAEKASQWCWGLETATDVRDLGQIV